MSTSETSQQDNRPDVEKMVESLRRLAHYSNRPMGVMITRAVERYGAHVNLAGLGDRALATCLRKYADELNRERPTEQP